ncbi:MAG: UvrD-helicase domain-containing protein [Nitrospirae bacterium]|nr:UvrD-helicase domain-containing protein [Nitrospirota bacterium]
MTELPDDKDRLLAVTTFDKNVVVTAGAGTGKTTLLVDRITHLLMRDTAPLKITDVVAITFTKKAANEMKIRLRKRLHYFMDCAGRMRGVSHMVENNSSNDSEADNYSSKINDYEAALLNDLIQRYDLSPDLIAQRAEDAINNLEKAQIGTIHSFAGHILRLYPLEAGIAPDFDEDDGSGFEGHFEREWEEWLDPELSVDSGHGEEWKEVLRRVPLEGVKMFAKCLCKETIPLSSFSHSVLYPGKEPQQLSGKFLTWLEQEKRNAGEILIKYDGSRKVKMHGLLKSAMELFDNLIASTEFTPFDDNIPSTKPAGWKEDDYREAVRIAAVAQSLSVTDDQFIGKLTALISPFSVSCRKSFVLSGNISFDGLLSFCCNILKNNGSIRSNIKKDFKSILVDEFQDTDPLQYEIILYLAEAHDEFKRDWREIKLAPGKLFIVGDPKQSIYAFRGADIEAFHKVVDMVLTQGGVRANLSTNFRSHGGIINVVNSVCRQIIRGRDYLQPEYVDIIERPGSGAVKPIQRVELRLLDSRNEDDCDAAEAIEREAMALGKFLKEEMIGKEIITDSAGCEVPVSPRHIAILLPKLTQVHEYLDVLKRLSIPYIVEGDRHFYGTQEVIDFVNLLRVLDNPLDRTAMAGFLRSPLGGLSDRELYELCRMSLLDYRMENGRLNEGLDKLNNAGFSESSLNDMKEHVRALYGLMKHLNVNISVLPVPDAIHYIFDYSPVLELAASSYHGEQSVANLQKIYRIAAAMSDKSGLTLKGLTILLEERVASREKEGESLLSEEGVDAVRILSIHRAKGLEFPVVIVGGMQGIQNRGSDPASVTYDWAAGMTGISIGGISNHSSVMMQDKKRLIEKEELKRLLYVAMTRAGECLILSGVIGKRVYKDSFLSMIMETIGESAGDSLVNDISVEKGVIKQTVIKFKSSATPERYARDIKIGDDRISLEKIEVLSGLWDKRGDVCRAILEKPFFLTPSSVEKKTAASSVKIKKPDNDRLVSAQRSILIGNIAHYVLSNWDFAANVSLFGEAVKDACRKFIAQAGSLEGVSDKGGGDYEKIQNELVCLFEKFSASSAYQELKGAEILGNEVPFSIPWDGRVMEGVIDIIYRYRDKLYAADYKTDMVREEEMESKCREYSVSADIYMNAVRACTGIGLEGFKLIFLRHGRSMKV